MQLLAIGIEPPRIGNCTKYSEILYLLGINLPSYVCVVHVLKTYAQFLLFHPQKIN
jgi:hypothetical protein